MKRLVMILVVLTAAACGPGGVINAGPVTTRPPVVDDTSTTTTTTTPTTSSDGVTTTTSTTTTIPDSGRSVDVFLIKGSEYAVGISRSVPDTPAVARNAMAALLAGPTPSEAAEGFTTAIPEDTLLLDITIDEGVATVDLSREFEAGGGSFAMLSRLAQVVYTLTQFPTVDSVRFHLDGQAVSVFSGEGIVLEDPVARADYVSLLPLAPPPTGSPPRWEQADLPEGGSGPPAQVVGVAADDVLNVRTAPGVDHPIIGMLPPGTVVRMTGNEGPVGSAVWVEIHTPNGFGWVNGRFLGPTG